MRSTAAPCLHRFIPDRLGKHLSAWEVVKGTVGDGCISSYTGKLGACKPARSAIWWVPHGDMAMALVGFSLEFFQCFPTKHNGTSSFPCQFALLPISHQLFRLLGAYGRWSWPCPAGSGWLCARAGTLPFICCAQGAAARAWGLSGLWALARVRASSAAKIDLKASIRRSYKSWTQPNCLPVPSAPFSISRRQHRRAIALSHFSGGLIESSLVFPVQVLGKLSFIMSCAANEISISQINCSNFLPLEWLDVALEVLLSSANSHWALMHRGKAPSP